MTSTSISITISPLLNRNPNMNRTNVINVDNIDPIDFLDFKNTVSNIIQILEKESNTTDFYLNTSKLSTKSLAIFLQMLFKQAYKFDKYI